MVCTAFFTVAISLQALNPKTANMTTAAGTAVFRRSPGPTEDRVDRVVPFAIALPSAGPPPCLCEGRPPSSIRRNYDALREYGAFAGGVDLLLCDG